MHKLNCLFSLRFLLTALVVFIGISGLHADIIEAGPSTVFSVKDDPIIRGTVLDKSGEPIIGASIIQKGTTIGTVTDIDGNFTLNVATGSVLQISYIGYITQEVVDGGKPLNIILEEDNQILDEIVVVGFGVQKKVNLTGSVSAITASELASRPVTNTSTALQGALPGVTIIQNSGQPGKDNSSVSIRGIGTLNNANPMYVVDGLIVSTINDIDPNDIENLSVLKDAASAAIYGSRAANGVILITTKKGTKKAPTLKYDGYVGWQTPTAMQEYLPSWEYAELYNKALVNEGKNPFYSAEDIAKFRDGSDPDNFPNTDWLSLLYKKSGFQQSHRVEVTGGGDNATYMISLGHLSQDGIIPLSDFKRYNARANVNTQINKLSASLNMSYVFGDIREPSNPYTGDMYQILRQINRISPFVTNKYSNGYYGYIADGNPIQWVENGSLRNEKYHTLRGAGTVAYEIIDGLKISEMLGYEYTSKSDEKFIKDSQFYNWKTGAPTLYQGPNNQTDERSDYQMVSLQTLLTYNKTFDKHTFGGILGYSQEYTRYDWTKGYRKNFLNNDLWELDAGSPDGQEATGSAYEYALMSYFGRITYDYDNRYLFEANLRRDGTSRISKAGRWGTFPSFSAAWRIINESFMENVRNTLSDAKVRVGWGRLGNQNIGNYPYQSVLAQKNYSLGGKVVSGVAPVDGANSDLKWETSETMNVGVDVGFLNNRFTLSLDAYNRDTYDILLQLPVSTLYGLEAPYQNAGEVNNKGIEMQLGYRQTVSDWSFDATVNVSYNENKIVDLKNDGARIWDGFKFKQNGYPVNSFGGYEVLGLFQTQEEVDNYAVVNRSRVGPGDFKYKNQNDDDIINGDDRVYLGSWTPKWIFGANINVGWRDFDLGLQFSGAADVKGYLQTETIGELGGNTSKPTTLFRDSWDAETNPNGKFPRPLSSWNHNFSNVPSSFWIIDASYLRVKNLQIGYTLPKKVIEGIGISHLRLYYSGQNLFTFTGFNKGFDPEAPAGARAYYPQVKVNTFGLSVTF